MAELGPSPAQPGTLARTRLLGRGPTLLGRTAVVLGAVTVALAVLIAWSRPAPDVVPAAARAAIVVECADRVANGLSADQSTCRSWATEAYLASGTSGRTQTDLVTLAGATVIGVLAWLVIDAAAGLLSRRPIEAP